MSYGDMRTYRTFEEFEREELRRMEAGSRSVDDMIDTVFAEELDFEGTGGKRSSYDDDED